MDANIKTPQDALEWLERHIHKEAEADGEMTNEHAIQLGFIQNMLAKFPRRNCEVGTAMEQGERFSAYCQAHKHPESECLLCPLFGQTGGYCELAWAQMPYEEGGAK